MESKKWGFTLVEVAIAVSMLIIVSLVFVTMMTDSAKRNSTTRAVGIRDMGFYNIMRFASDPVALSLTYQNSNVGTTGIEINPCFRTCLDPTVTLNTKCSASAASRQAACVSWTQSGTSAQVTQWYPLTIYDPNTGTATQAIAGPNPAASATTTADNRQAIRYTMQGVACSDPSVSDIACPIYAKVEFTPICPRLAATCYTANSIIVKNTFHWTTSTLTSLVAGRSKMLALKSLSNKMPVSLCQILGRSSCRSFFNYATSSAIGTSP